MNDVMIFVCTFTGDYMNSPHEYCWPFKSNIDMYNGMFYYIFIYTVKLI